MWTLTIWDINPEPWKSVGVGRYGPAVKDGKLVAYQQALKDELDGCTPIYRDLEDVLLSVSFYFWRSSQHGKQADATNLQKATEDALQGHLFVNDKYNWHVQSYIMEQSPTTRPCILVHLDLYERPDVDRDPPPEAPTLFSDSTWTPPQEEQF